jgi:hypothetical protein
LSVYRDGGDAMRYWYVSFHFYTYEGCSGVGQWMFSSDEGGFMYSDAIKTIKEDEDYKNVTIIHVGETTEEDFKQFTEYFSHRNKREE